MIVLRDSFSKTNGVLYVQELYFFKIKKPLFTFTFTVHVSFIVKQGSDNLMFFAYRAISYQILPYLILWVIVLLKVRMSQSFLYCDPFVGIES